MNKMHEPEIFARRRAEAAEEQSALTQYAQSAWQRVEQIVTEHPKECLIAALAAGAMLGWIIKRR